MSKPQKKPLQPWAEQMIDAFHLSPLEDDEFFVQWETGRLGVNISEDKESELPYVSKITDANSPLAAAMEVGDFLLCVNELRAEENSFNNFLRLLTTKQKPVLLRFRRGTPASRSRIIASHDAKYPAPSSSSSLQRKASKEELQPPSSSKAPPALRPISTSDNSAGTTATTSRLSSRLSPSLPSASAIASMFTRTTSAPQGEAAASPVPPPAIVPLVERRRATSIPDSRAALSPPQQRPPATSIGAAVGTAPPNPPPKKLSSASSSSSSASDDAAAFMFSWVDGPLGVYFGEDEATQLPVVTRTLPHASPLITANVQVGDTLVSANGLLSRDHPFGEFFAALQKMSKPIQLVFAPSTAPLSPGSDDVSSGSRSGPSDDVVVNDHVTTDKDTQRPSPPPRSPATRTDFGGKEHVAKTDGADVKKPPAAQHVVDSPPPPAPKAAASTSFGGRDPRPAVVASVPDERPYTSDDDDDDDKATPLHGHASAAHTSRDDDDDDDDDNNVITDVDLDLESGDDDDDDDAADAVMPTLEFIKGAPTSTSKRPTGDSPTQSSRTTPLARPTATQSSAGASSSSGNNERTGGSRRGRSGGKGKRNNFNALARLPCVNELEEQTIALAEPTSVNMKLTVRGRLKTQRVSKADTPDSSMYLIKWKENRSIGVQLRECRLAKGVYPMVVLVCREACCESLRHVQIGDLLLEINGRDTAMMSVKKTIAFVKTCSKTALLKFKRGPGISVSRVSA